MRRSKSSSELSSPKNEGEDVGLLSLHIEDEHGDFGMRAGKEKETRRERKPLLSSTPYILTFVVILIADLITCVYIVRLLQDKLLPGTTELWEMEYRNPYVNLNQLYSQKNTTTQYQPLVNTPRVAVQLNKDDPDRAVNSRHQIFDPSWGTLSPPDRRLHVKPGVHTVSQFRAIDFGMERCTLALQLPPPNTEQPYGFAFKSGTSLDVCRVNLKSPKEVLNLSWSHHRCDERVGKLSGQPGKEALLVGTNGENYFPCAWGTLHTFHFACSADSPECEIDVWSGNHQSWGVSMVQHQTV